MLLIHGVRRDSVLNNMWFLPVIILTLLLGTAADTKEKCPCKEVLPGEKAEWSFETIQIQVKEPVKRISGTVRDATGAVIPNALVEIYTASETMDMERKSKIEMSPSPLRIAACKTDKDGGYCFVNTKSGNYTVSVTAGQGFCKTEIVVNLRIGNKLKESLPDIILEVGK